MEVLPGTIYKNCFQISSYFYQSSYNNETTDKNVGKDARKQPPSPCWVVNCYSHYDIQSGKFSNTETKTTI